MDTPDQEPCCNSVVGPASTLVVKSDRLCAYAVRRTVTETFPATSLFICHTGAETLKVLRHAPVQFGIFGLGLPDVDGLDLIIRVTEIGRASCRERV